MAEEFHAPRASWPRVLVASGTIFLVYQASEAMQTVLGWPGPAGPALMLASLLIAWPLGWWLGFAGYDAYGLRLRRDVPRILACGMLLASLAKLASLTIGLSLGDFAASRQAGLLSPAGFALAALTTFVPSISEDILTRGILLHAAPVRLRFWSYTALSAGIYTANHIWRFDWGLSEQVRLFCLGLAYGAAAWRWRSLWGAVALHWGWNLTNLLTDSLVPLDTVDAIGARGLSAAAHLVLLAILLALPKVFGAGDERSG